MKPKTIDKQFPYNALSTWYLTLRELMAARRQFNILNGMWTPCTVEHSLFSFFYGQYRLFETQLIIFVNTKMNVTSYGKKLGFVLKKWMLYAHTYRWHKGLFG